MAPSNSSAHLTHTTHTYTHTRWVSIFYGGFPWT